MRVTIVVLDVASRDGRDLIQARGMFDTGQELIRGAVREGRDLQSRTCAVAELANWLRDNRPGYELGCSLALAGCHTGHNTCVAGSLQCTERGNSQCVAGCSGSPDC